MRQTEIGILGVGDWVAALAQLLTANDARVFYCNANLYGSQEVRSTTSSHPASREENGLPEDVEVVTDGRDLLKRCKLVFLLHPFTFLIPVLRQLAPHFQGDHMLVHRIRGLEPETLMTPSQLIRRETCVKQTGCVSGPNVVKEVLDGLPTAMVVASRFIHLRSEINRLLSNQNFRLFGSDDLVGVEVAGVLKNIYAIAAGVADSRQVGNNAKAYLLTRGLAETAQILRLLGGAPRTLLGLGGIGAFLASSYSGTNANYLYGLQLGGGTSSGDSPNIAGFTPEGVAILPAIYKWSREQRIRLHLIRAMYRMIADGKTFEVSIAPLLRVPYTDDVSYL